jgi:hypothetical protein
VHGEGSAGNGQMLGPTSEREPDQRFPSLSGYPTAEICYCPRPGTTLPSHQRPGHYAAGRGDPLSAWAAPMAMA